MAEDPMPSHHGIDDQLDRQGGAPPAGDTIRLLRGRASCRDFAERPVPPEVMDEILACGTRAASGGNLQPWSVIRIEERETREWLAHLNGQPFMRHAPVHLLFCLDLHRLERWAAIEDAPFTANRALRHFWIAFQDVVIAAQSVCTAADALGLASVYIGTVIDEVAAVRERFALPPGVFPVVVLCVGYPASRAAPRRKLDASTLVHRERYRDPGDSELRAAMNEKYEGLRVEITPERLETLAQVCRRTSGEDLAHRCLERVRRQGYISPVQRYFGLHYRADLMPEANAELLGWLIEAGFECLRPPDRG